MKFFKVQRSKGWLAIFVAFLLLAFGSSNLNAGSQPNWIQLSPGEARAPGINLTESNFSQVVFEVNIPGMWSEEVQTKGGLFNQLFIPECGITSTIGEPRLPVMSKMVQIPYGAEVDVEVVSSEFREFSLEELGIANRIVPVQAPGQLQSKGRELETVFFRRSQSHFDWL